MVEGLFAEQSQNTSLYFDGKLTNTDFLVRQNAVVQALRPVVMDNLAEFLETMRASGLSEQQVRDVAAHENDHMREAEVRGLAGKYAIVHSIRSDGEYITHPFMTYSLGSLSANERRATEVAITSAPEHLSDGDKAHLNRLKEDKA